MKLLLSRGFTLIEILLVIALLAVVASLTIPSYQKQANNNKIDKTALQIQQLLQAGSAYYVDNNCWPSNNNDINSTCSQTPAPDFTPYIPVGSDTNPWGYRYDVQPYNQNLLQVQTQVPNTRFANSIAAQLPNATVVTNEGITLVTAQVPRPGQAATTGLTIQLKGSVTANSSNQGNLSTANFSCAQGEVGDLLFNGRNYQTQQYGNNGAFPVYLLKTSYTCPSFGSNSYTCNIKVTYLTMVYNGSSVSTCSLFGGSPGSYCQMINQGVVTLNYIAYCRSPLPGEKSNTNNSHSPFTFQQEDT